MHIRISTLRLPPENISRIERLIEQSVLPAARREQGFHSLIASSSLEEGKMVVITLWDSEELMRRTEEGEYFQEQLSKAISMLSGPPETDHMRVSVVS